MEQKGGLLQWRLSLAETLAFAATVVSITLWMLNFFQTKADANEWKDSMENRVGKIEVEISSIRGSMETIGRDVSYIRGRLEPKPER